MTMNTMHKALLGIVFLGVSHQACLAGGKKCVKEPSKITEICLEWDLNPKPQEGADFLLDFTDPANPAITLKTGNMGWAMTSVSRTAWRLMSDGASSRKPILLNSNDRPETTIMGGDAVAPYHQPNTQ